MRYIAIKVNFIDQPNSAHKSHVEPVPYLGGLAIIFGVLLTVYGSIFFHANIDQYFWTANSIFFPALILGAIGLLDDYKSLPPFPRFVAQSAVAVLTSILIISSNTVGNPSGHSTLDALITVVWIVGICNAVNFFDNLDGGAAGAIAATSIGLFFIANSNEQFLISSASIVVFGGMLGFLIWNSSPAKIYMGDAGSLFLGVVIAGLTVRLDPNVSSITNSFAIPIFLLALPILDTSVAVISRIRRRRSVFVGGQDHLSHRLIRKGLSKEKTALILWSLALIFVSSGCAISISQKYGNVLVALSALFWITLLFAFLNSEDE